MQQYRQLSRHSHHRLLLGLLAPFLLVLLPSLALLLSSLPSPQAFRSLSGAPCRRMQCAPCTNIRRSNLSPALVIPNSARSPRYPAVCASVPSTVPHPGYGRTAAHLRWSTCRSTRSASLLRKPASATSSPGIVPLSLDFLVVLSDLLTDLLHALQQRSDDRLHFLLHPLRQRFLHPIGVALL